VTSFARSARGAQIQFPELKHGRKGTVAPVIPEEVVQKAIIRGLETYGYLVMVTSRIRKRSCCGNCGTWSFAAGGDGVTKGCPDLYVSHLRWPDACWMGIEVKGEKTPLSVEQKQLRENRRIVVARSFEDAIAAVKAFEASKWGGE